MGRLHRFRWATAVAALVDDELDGRGAARVLGHLERCPDCLDELHELARLRRSLSRLTPVG